MGGKDGGFYIMAFNSASHSIQAEKKASGAFRISVIPTPLEISGSCGFALKFHDGGYGAIKEFYDDLEVPAEIYYLGKKDGGKREVRKLT